MTQRQLYLGALSDNRRWDQVKLRSDDVIVVTPPKCGTTWMQTIVALLITGDPHVETELSVRMPWVDIRIREMPEVAERLENMNHRRSMKSHTPIDGLPLHPEVQYLCVFRHPLDAHFSFRNHIRNVPIGWYDHWYPEDDPDGITFRRFLDGGPEGFDMDAMPLAHILRHYKTARALADRPNVTLFHYADMKRDLAGTFEHVAKLLGVTYAPAQMEELVSQATFDNMKQNAARFAPSGGKGFFKSDSAFFQSGKHQKWIGELSDAELAAYDAAMDAALTKDERDWLENGAGTGV
ncbi:sulfotransferase domain-containing protein [Yoonia litorea]|uniref:Sulfotransferase domain-containing protein n=1 Tax=Yoonia litorea TaxID=1123755 RepID=A0A1I6MEF5_9RHOB|nr:sulfotransferase domain-containing protein [Yoonia litorea]SFS14075.1 Sulfotransferase domain-containing protein [Yoonia litorea]